MYTELFNKVTVIIAQLQEIQQQTEQMYIESSESKIIRLVQEDDMITAEHISVDNITEAEFHEELEKGYADYLTGKGRLAKDVFTDIRKEFNP